MGNIRAWLLALALVGVPTICDAGTIFYPGFGTLDASLTSYDLQGNVMREYTLGTDFMPGLPVGIMLTHNSYVACAGGPSGCDSINTVGVFPVIPFFITGTGDNGFFGDPGEQTPLADGCTQYRDIFFTGIPVLVARGGCSFTDKMLIAEHALFDSVLVEDTSGAPSLGIPGLLPGSPAGMPLFLITSAVATELRIPIIPGPNFMPGLNMSVQWTPLTVPEPASLSLLGIGLAALGVVRRRNQSSASRTPHRC
jgi:hypothetical protein